MGSRCADASGVIRERRPCRSVAPGSGSRSSSPSCSRTAASSGSRASGGVERPSASPFPRAGRPPRSPRAEEVARPDEGSDARRGRGEAVLLHIADVRRAREIDAIETRELEEHPGLGLAAVAAILVRVGTEPPVGKGATEPLVRPGHAAVDLGHADLARRDAWLIRHDETHVEAWALARQDRRHVRHKDRSEEHTSELQSRLHLVCRLLLEKKKKNKEVRHYSCRRTWHTRITN